MSGLEKQMWGKNQFLSNHAPHADTDDVNLSLCCPSQVIDQLQRILGHFRCRVPPHRLIAISHPPIVEDEAGVL